MLRAPHKNCSRTCTSNDDRIKTERMNRRWKWFNVVATENCVWHSGTQCENSVTWKVNEGAHTHNVFSTWTRDMPDRPLSKCKHNSHAHTSAHNLWIVEGEFRFVSSFPHPTHSVHFIVAIRRHTRWVECTVMRLNMVSNKLLGLSVAHIGRGKWTACGERMLRWTKSFILHFTTLYRVLNLITLSSRYYESTCWDICVSEKLLEATHSDVACLLLPLLLRMLMYLLWNDDFVVVSARCRYRSANGSFENRPALLLHLPTPSVYKHKLRGYRLNYLWANSGERDL